MISTQDKDIIIECAKKYNPSVVYLFGSSIDSSSDFNDIDIAVKGLKSSLFFKFYGELFKKLSKPVDLVDLSDNSLFNQLIQKRGIQIYG